MGKLDALVAEAADITFNLSARNLDEIADLTRRLSQHTARAAGAILPEALARSYMQCSDSERAGARAAVEKVLTALVLLGYIETQTL